MQALRVPTIWTALRLGGSGIRTLNAAKSSTRVSLIHATAHIAPHTVESLTPLKTKIGLLQIATLLQILRPSECLETEPWTHRDHRTTPAKQNSFSRKKKSKNQEQCSVA